MNNNPYDNNPYNQNQNGNMNGNPYGNRPQNMNQGGYNPNGAPRPPYPQPQMTPAQARAADNDKTTKTIIIVIGAIVAVAIIALVSVFAIKQINDRKQNDTPGYTEVNINFNISNYEDVFDDIENDYYDENGRIPDSKLAEVVQKDYTYITEYNKTNNIFEDIQINEKENYISCTLPGGYTYYHYPNRASHIEDSEGNVVDEEQTTEATNNETETETSQETNNGLSKEFLEKLMSSTWYDQRRHDGYDFVFDDEGNVTVTYGGAKIEPQTKTIKYEVVSENEIKFTFEYDYDGGFSEEFDIVYSDEEDVLPYTVDGQEVMDGYLHTSFEAACEARQEYF